MGAFNDCILSFGRHFFIKMFLRMIIEAKDEEEAKRGGRMFYNLFIYIFLHNLIKIGRLVPPSN